MQQVWFPASERPAAGCEGAVRSLGAAIGRARAAAASGGDDERLALARFRQALEPEWSTRAGVQSACAGDDRALDQLRDLDALRYAEEHAVRYESHGLAPLRRRVQATAASSPSSSER